LYFDYEIQIVGIAECHDEITRLDAIALSLLLEILCGKKHL